MADETITRAQAAQRLDITAQAVSKMIAEGALLPTGPDGALTPRDVAAIEWAHKVREMCGFKLDQLRPFARFAQRGDHEMMRRCVFVKRRIGGSPGNWEKRWTLEVFSRPMTGDDAEMRRKVAEAEGSDLETIEAAFSLDRFAADTFEAEVRRIESAVRKEVQSTLEAKARLRRRKK